MRSFEQRDGDETDDSDADVGSGRRSARGSSKGKKKGESVHDLQSYARRSRAWLQVTEPPKDVDDDYVPQPGDVVMYFHQGHLACLEGGYPGQDRVGRKLQPEHIAPYDFTIVCETKLESTELFSARSNRHLSMQYVLEGSSQTSLCI
jgi:hypothetical protein